MSGSRWQKKQQLLKKITHYNQPKHMRSRRWWYAVAEGYKLYRAMEYWKKTSAGLMSPGFYCKTLVTIWSKHHHHRICPVLYEQLKLLVAVYWCSYVLLVYISPHSTYWETFTLHYITPHLVNAFYSKQIATEKIQLNNVTQRGDIYGNEKGSKHWTLRHSLEIIAESFLEHDTGLCGLMASTITISVQ